MADHAARHLRRRGAAAGWCCSFAGVPPSPDHHHHHHHRSLPSPSAAAAPAGGARKQQQLPPVPKSPSSFHSSPSSKLAGFIDYPRRILSPGRVSPIDDPPLPPPPPQQQPAPFVAVREEEREEEGLDLRLCLRGRDGGCVVVMELDSAVLCHSSAFFAAMAPAAAGGGGGGKRIEVDGVDNVAAFRDAVELMFEADPLRWLARAGVSRAIAVLEVRCACIPSFLFLS
jgi:hypothetical protein